MISTDSKSDCDSGSDESILVQGIYNSSCAKYKSIYLSYNMQEKQMSVKLELSQQLLQYVMSVELVHLQYNWFLQGSIFVSH